MLKVYFLVILYLLSNFYIFSDDIINRIVYKKTVIDFNDPVLVNVYLSQMQADDVIVIFNNDELSSVNKNLKPYVKDDNNFTPSFSFEVANIKKDNSLQVFVVLSQGITVNSEATLSFEKGQIFDNNNFQIKKDKIFFIRAGEYISDEVFYNIEIDNGLVIEKVEEITKNNVLYYKLRSKKEGTSKVEIYKYDEALEKQNTLPLKSLRVTVGN
jgi:hypothetical protein